MLASLSNFAGSMRQNVPTYYITRFGGDFVPKNVLSQGVELFSQCTHIFFTEPAAEFALRTLQKNSRWCEVDATAAGGLYLVFEENARPIRAG
jgi:hypothetical protein